MKKFFDEFKIFIAKGNVIELAVGVMIGAAFKTIVDSLVNDILSPILGLIAKGDLSELSIELGGVTIGYGAFLTAIINFILMAFMLFLIVKAMNSARTLGQRRKPQPEAAAKPRRCPYCREEVAADASRCPHCTSVLEISERPESDTEA